MRQTENVRYSARKIRIALTMIALGSLACSSSRWVTPWERAKPEVEPETPTAQVEVVSSHYLVVSLARPGLHIDSAERIARLLRDGLAQDGQSVTLAEDLGVTLEARRKRANLFERLFYAPDAGVLEKVRRRTERTGVERVITCMLLDYGEQWRRDRKVKRIVVQAACDDLPSGTRLARFQVVAERSGKRDAFSDVERLAARDLLEGLRSELRATPEAGQEVIQSSARAESAQDASPSTVPDASRATRPAAHPAERSE